MVGFSGHTWLAIVGVTICAQLLGHSVLNHLLAVMSPGLISLLLLFEVPGAAILAGVFLDQTPPVGVYVGLALILAGLVVVVLRRPPPEEVLADVRRLTGGNQGHLSHRTTYQLPVGTVSRSTSATCEEPRNGSSCPH